MSTLRDGINGTEAAILSRVFEPDEGTLSRVAARAFLKFGFGLADQERMRDLSAKAQDGSLTPAEQAEINNYELIGHILSLLKSKARRSLRDKETTNRRTKVN